jgi:hypothetical protein
LHGACGDNSCLFAVATEDLVVCVIFVQIAKTGLVYLLLHCECVAGASLVTL